MMPELMFKEIIIIPPGFSILIIILLFIYAIREARRHYIGRLEIVGNILLLWQIYYYSWGALPITFQLYLNLGSVLALIAFLSYLFDVPLSIKFYKLCFWLYSATAILIIFFILPLLDISLFNVGTPQINTTFNWTLNNS